MAQKVGVIENDQKPAIPQPNPPQAVKQPEVINDKTMTEIKRKADAGLKLFDPTDAKMKAYNDYLATKAPAPSTDPTTPAPQVNPLDALNSNIQQQGNGYYANQEALLGQARDKQIADLERSYNDAVEQGQISVRDAEEQFRKQSESINQKAYQDSQITNLTAEGRGIGNSQQLLGLMSGDNARNNGLINENITTRDKRINDVRDRINTLTKNKSLDINSANTQYNLGLAGARGQADMMMADKQFQLGLSNYEANRNFDFDLQKMDKQQVQVLEQMAKQQGYDLSKMSQQQVYQLAQMAKQQNYDVAKMNIQQKNTLSQMAKQQGYDLAKMSQAQVNDLVKMAKQQGYNMDLQNDSQAHDSAMLDKKNAFDVANMATQHGFQMSEIDARGQAELKSIGARAQAEADAVEKEYQTAMSRELKKYTPGTQEYTIAQKQLESEKSRALTEIHTKAQAQAGAEFAKGLEKEAPTPPKSGLFGVSEKAQREYDNKLKSYYRYLDWQDDGQFNSSKKTGLQGDTYLK